MSIVDAKHYNMVNISDKPGENNSWFRLPGVLFIFLITYTWAKPFRDIYGLETRNALMAREMLEDGISLIPKVLGQPYPDYPPLYFWLEAGSVTIDMLLAFNITAAIFCLYFRDNSQHFRVKITYTISAVIFLIFAFLTKGLIGIVLPGISWGGYLLWERRWKHLFSFVLFMASGRAFVEAAESKVDPKLPLVVFGINPDGDGVKFALYSKRKPSAIHYINSFEDLIMIEKPCLFISRLDNKAVLNKYLSENYCKTLAKGNIYSKQFVACLLGNGE